MKDTVGEIAVSSLRDVISVVWLSNQVEQPERAAEHGLAVDGAVRPQDRSFFEGGKRPMASPIYRCAAAEAQAVGRVRLGVCSVQYC
jgi:hypothetical protein